MSNQHPANPPEPSPRQQIAGLETTPLIPQDMQVTTPDGNMAQPRGSSHRKAVGRSPGRKGRTRRVLLSSIAVALILALAAWHVLPRMLQGKGEETQTQRLASVTRGDLTVSITGSAPLEPAGRQTISAVIGSTITGIHHKNGDSVKQGDLLLTLDPTDAEAALKEAEYALEDSLSGQADTTDALASLVMRAPFTGRIVNLAVQEEDEVNANTTMLTLADTENLTVTIPFGISDQASLQAGQTARLSFSSMEGELAGTVSHVGEDSHVLAGGQVVDVEVSLKNPGVLAEGMSTTVEIQTDKGWLTGMEAGTLAFSQTKEIRAESGGTVQSVAVRKNQHVEEGTLLLVMQNDSLQKSADSNKRKIDTLAAKVREAQTVLDSCEVRAPMDGIVTSLNAAVGDAVNPGNALCAILDVSTMTMEISIDELDISTVAIGQQVTVTVDAVEETALTPIKGSVTGIAVEGSYVNGVTTFPVSISLVPDDRLRSGMNADASIRVTNLSDVLLVPIEAVTTAGGRSFVYLRGTAEANRDRAEGTVPENKPEGFDPENMPEGFDPENMPEGFDPENMPEGFSPENRPEGFNSGGRTTRETGRLGGNRGSGETSASGSTGSGLRNGIQAANTDTARSSTSSYYAGTTRVQVVTGAHNETYIEITSGLSEGDQVVLPPLTAPSSSGTSQTTQTGGFGGLMGGGIPAAGMPAGGPDMGGGGFRPN